MRWQAYSFRAPCGICEKPWLRANRVPSCEERLASFTPIPKRACELCGRHSTEVEAGLRCANLCPAALGVCAGTRHGDLRRRAGERGLDAQGSPHGAPGKMVRPTLGAAGAKPKGRRAARTLWYRYRYGGIGARSAVSTKPRCSPKPPAKALKLPCKLNLLVLTREPAAKSGCSQSKSGARRSVARLPHGQAAKLTSYASYW
jgi:hypothetical protein